MFDKTKRPLTPSEEALACQIVDCVCAGAVVDLVADRLPQDPVERRFELTQICALVGLDSLDAVEEWLVDHPVTGLGEDDDGSDDLMEDPRHFESLVEGARFSDPF